MIFITIQSFDTREHIVQALGDRLCDDAVKSRPKYELLHPKDTLAIDTRDSQGKDCWLLA